jgi:hypothetical protein
VEWRTGKTRKGIQKGCAGVGKMEARRGDSVAQAINLWDGKGTLGRIDAEAVGGQHFKNLLKVEEMLLSGWAENEEIIQVNEKEGKGTEKGIHEALESLGSIF